MSRDRSTFVHRGVTFTVEHPRDDDAGEPWTRADGHGVITGWIPREEAPEGARELGGGRESIARFYDLRATVTRARAEAWGLDQGD